MRFSGAVIILKGEDRLGQVAITYRIMPESPEVDLVDLVAKIKDAAREIAKLEGMAEKPVAFGINAILVRIVVEDKEGGSEEIETALSGIEGVQSVEAMEMSRLL